MSVEVKIGKAVNEQINQPLQNAVAEFVGLKLEADAIKEKMELSKLAIVEEAQKALAKNDASTVTFTVPGLGGVRVSFGWDVKVGDVQRLEQYLGDRFGDLVKIERVFKPEPKLKEMALHDDGLKECLLIKEKSPSVAVV